MPDLLFDKDKHEYRHNNIILPGVTSILESGGLKEPYANISGTTGKGTRIHHYCEYMDQDDLDWSVISKSDLPYVEAYKDFKNKTGFKPRLIESPQHSHEHEYATVIDRTGVFDFNLVFKYVTLHQGMEVLLEIKTFPKQKWWGVQLAGQRTAYTPMTINRIALELRKSGRWKLHEFNDPDDYDCWFACLDIHKWRNK